jgi:nucleoside-diphosphate-sugar epimerase
MKNIIISGAFGFLGASLVRYFVDSRNYRITILVKSFSRNLRISNNYLKEINIIYIDKADFKQKLNDIDRPIIIHAANDYGPQKNLTQLISSNVIFPLQLIEDVKSELFINFDSYFTKSNQNYDYLGNYVLSKKLLETCLMNLSNSKVINLKLEHLYGPYDGENKFTYQLFYALKNKNHFDTTVGIQKRDFLFINDLIDLISEIIKKHDLFQKGYHGFEVGTGHSISIKEFIQAAKIIFCSNATINFGALPIRTNEIMDSFANLDLLPGFLKWKPKIDIEEGISYIKDLEK